MRVGIRLLLVFSLLATFIVATPAAVNAADFTVTSDADDCTTVPAGSLRDAITQANAAGAGTHTITFADSVEQINLACQLEIDNNQATIILNAPANGLTLSGQDSHRVLYIHPGSTVTINGLTITEGSVSSNNGGGIYNEGNLTLVDSVVSNSTALGPDQGTGSGGGIYSTGPITLSGTTLSSNTSSFQGGGLYGSISAPVTINNESIISGNASMRGGGIWIRLSLSMSDSSVVDNELLNVGVGQVSLGGGIYLLFTEQATITNTTFARNSALPYGEGGGVALNGATANIVNSTIEDNHAENGAGLYTDSSTATFTDSTISNNHASADGGGIHTSGSATDIIISGSTIFDNTAQRGAGIYHGTGSLEVHSATTVSENTSVAHGAGIYNAATMSVNDTTISGNISTTGSGAGVYQSTQSTSRSSITRTAIIDNRASINSGAIYLSSGALLIDSSTLSGNSAIGAGAIRTHGELEIRNSTISGNTADGGNYGGIQIGAGAEVKISDSTISNNVMTLDTAGNVAAGISDAPLEMTRTIVAGNLENYPDNPQPSDMMGTVITGAGYNLVGVGINLQGIADGENGNIVGTTDNPIDPMLEALADNGGPTDTMFPLENSPVINAGGDACPDTDQRGLIRPAGTACDIGAVEVQLATISVPDDIQTTATSAAGATVDFASEVSAELPDGSPVDVDCIPPSGSTFPIDTTSVECTAAGERDYTSTTSFEVTVIPPDPPTLVLPDDITVNATSPAGTTVTFDATATDGLGTDLTVFCDPASGSTFAPGSTTVECETTDDFGQTVEDSFTVTVLDGHQQLHQLIQDVRGGSASFLIKPRLLALLAAADLSLHRGQTTGTCASLTAFTATVQLYGTVRLIPADLTAQWSSDAVRIMGALGCGGSAVVDTPSASEPEPDPEPPAVNPPDDSGFNIFRFIFRSAGPAIRPWR